MVRWAGWLVVGILLAGAAYELALALGAGSIGPNPGDEVAGSSTVGHVALLAMLAAAAALAPSADSRPSPAALFAPAAAAYLGVLTRLQPRIGRFTTSAVVLVVLLTTVLAGDGH
jgi:uncharacterized protein YggT (Ycf19 family)